MTWFGFFWFVETYAQQPNLNSGVLHLHPTAGTWNHPTKLPKWISIFLGGFRLLVFFFRGLVKMCHCPMMRLQKKQFAKTNVHKMVMQWWWNPKVRKKNHLSTNPRSPHCGFFGAFCAPHVLQLQPELPSKLTWISAPPTCSNWMASRHLLWRSQALIIPFLLGSLFGKWWKDGNTEYAICTLKKKILNDWYLDDIPDVFQDACRQWYVYLQSICVFQK